MALNKARGNMYPFVDFTWNTVKGECPHQCTYCYMKRWGQQKSVRFDERELKTDLGRGNKIFIGSSCDLFAMDIPLQWVVKTLEEANRYQNSYLVQSKNPGGFHHYLEYMNPAHYVLATTLETNLHIPDIMGNSPDPETRAVEMAALPKEYRRMITIEPVMKFKPGVFADMILECNPVQVNIGADSGGHGLPEPSLWEIEELVYALEKEGIRVFQKKNLNRLLRNERPMKQAKNRLENLPSGSGQ